MSIKDYAIERAGQKLFVPTNEVNHGELSITFINDVDCNLRSFFHHWQRIAIHNWQENIGSLPLLAFGGYVSIHQFDNDHKEVFSIRVDNCWPQTISAIELSQDSESQIEEFSVDFKYTMQQIYKAY